MDITSEPNTPQKNGFRRRFLGVQFACCGVYSRIYLNKTQTAYEGFCPKCSRPIRIEIGPGGTGAAFLQGILSLSQIAVSGTLWQHGL